MGEQNYKLMAIIFWLKKCSGFSDTSLKLNYAILVFNIINDLDFLSQVKCHKLLKNIKKTVYLFFFMLTTFSTLLSITPKTNPQSIAAEKITFTS